MAKLSRKNIYKKKRNSKKKIQRRKRSIVRYFGSGNDRDYTDYTIDQINNMKTSEQLRSAGASIGRAFDRKKLDKTVSEEEIQNEGVIFVAKMHAIKRKYEDVYCKENPTLFGFGCPDMSKDPFIKTVIGNIANPNV